MDYLSKAGENKVCESVDPFVFRCMNQNEELLFGVASNMKENSELIARALVPNDSILVMLNVRLSRMNVYFYACILAILYIYLYTHAHTHAIIHVLNKHTFVCSLHVVSIILANRVLRSFCGAGCMIFFLCIIFLAKETW